MPVKVRLLLVSTLWLLLSAQMRPDEKIQILNVIDGRCFVDSQERQFCLKGIWAPPMKSPDFDGGPAPHAVLSRDDLWLRLQGQAVYIKNDGRPDRWGRQPAHILMAKGFPPLQEMLLEEGLVRIDPMDLPNEKYAARFRQAERTARDTETGLWALSWYRVLSSEAAEKALYQTRTVSATITEVTERRDRAYLNTGADYKTDFTITIPRRLKNRWLKQGADLQGLVGRRVEVTGFLANRNGPSIEVTDEDQLVVVD